jgi:carotenoid cleavage dioxygenase-like enzyme
MSYQLSSGPSLMDPFRPMRSEATAEECIVIHGEIPKGFYRAGPTWKRLVFEDGRADSRNRWVRTPRSHAPLPRNFVQSGQVVEAVHSLHHDRSTP